MCSYILLVTAGLLALVSCASTPSGLQRENELYLSTSNALYAVRSIAPVLPPPINGLLEGVLAVGGALMAVWASHLHRSLRDLQNGGPVLRPSTAEGGSPPRPAPAATGPTVPPPG